MATSFAPINFQQRSMSLPTPTVQKPQRPRGPKLSLDITSPQLASNATFSAPVTGITPTTQNTFSNSFMSSTPDLIQPPSESPGSFKPAPTIRHDSGSAHPPSASILIPKNTPPHTNSAPPSAISEPCPYALSPGIRSILVNGPLAKRSFSARTSSLASGPGVIESGTTTSPTQYGANKRVCFKQPLQEDIRTARYVLAHSDLPNRSPSPPGLGKRHSKRREREGDILRQSAEADAATRESDPNPSEITAAPKLSTQAEDKDELSVSATPKLGRRWRDREKMWSRATATAFVARDDIPRVHSPSPPLLSPTTVPATEIRRPPRLYSPPPPASNDDQTPSPEEHETPTGTGGLDSAPDRQQLSNALESFSTRSASPGADEKSGVAAGYPRTLQLPAALAAFKGGLSTSSASSEEDLAASMKESIAAAMAFS